jgi:hypothetical protein
VIERAVILARGGVLEFDLPITAQAAPGDQPTSPAGSATATGFLTEAEVQRFERDNLLRALEASNWKIGGPDGAAELLGVKPTTLLSRMDKWGRRGRKAYRNWWAETPSNLGLVRAAGRFEKMARLRWISYFQCLAKQRFSRGTPGTHLSIRLLCDKRGQFRQIDSQYLFLALA